MRLYCIGVSEDTRARWIAGSNSYYKRFFYSLLQRKVSRLPIIFCYSILRIIKYYRTEHTNNLLEIKSNILKYETYKYSPSGVPS